MQIEETLIVIEVEKKMMIMMKRMKKGALGEEGKIHFFFVEKKTLGKKFLKNATTCAYLTPVLNERLGQF